MEAAQATIMFCQFAADGRCSFNSRSNYLVSAMTEERNTGSQVARTVPAAVLDACPVSLLCERSGSPGRGSCSISDVCYRTSGGSIHLPLSV